MAKDLQQIKDEVSQEFGWRSWSSCYGDNGITNAVIDQIAIRYAEEQNSELVEMLEHILKWGKNKDDKFIFQSSTDKAKEIEQLINKHKGGKS